MTAVLFVAFPLTTAVRFAAFPLTTAVRFADFPLTAAALIAGSLLSTVASFAGIQAAVVVRNKQAVVRTLAAVEFGLEHFVLALAVDVSLSVVLVAFVVPAVLPVSMIVRSLLPALHSTATADTFDIVV